MPLFVGGGGFGGCFCYSGSKMLWTLSTHYFIATLPTPDFLTQYHRHSFYLQQKSVKKEKDGQSWRIAQQLKTTDVLAEDPEVQFSAPIWLTTIQKELNVILKIFHKKTRCGG